MTSAIADMYAEGPGRVVDDALAQLKASLGDRASNLADRTWGWMQSRAIDGQLSRYFTHPLAFPLLLLPWMLETSLRERPEKAFQTTLARSSIAGYFAIRMIDDVMDRDRPVPPEVLPAALILHSEFMLSYQRLFPSHHPFWSVFISEWSRGAEAASDDALLHDIDRTTFDAVAAHKVAAAAIPLAAVAFRSGRPDLVPACTAFVDRLGRWHQMLNDLRSWSEDLMQQRTTYFLSEPIRRGARGPQAIAEWVVREGIDWVSGELATMMSDLLMHAQALDSDAIVMYLEARRIESDVWFDRLAEATRSLELVNAALVEPPRMPRS